MIARSLTAPWIQKETIQSKIENITKSIFISANKRIHAILLNRQNVINSSSSLSMNSSLSFATRSLLVPTCETRKIRFKLKRHYRLEISGQKLAFEDDSPSFVP